MRVLVGCEFSGIVRDAFLAHGHDAWSCDLLPTERPGPHIQDDILAHLDEGWDLGVFHPPCTFLTVAANGWHARRPERQAKREQAFEFFMQLYRAPIARVCVENPIGVVSTLFRPADQIIQPWMFGNEQRKGTCLWMRRLPGILPTKVVEPEKVKGTSPKGKKYYSMNWLPQSDERWKIRSRTFPGVAAAMAEQWGILT